MTTLPPRRTPYFVAGGTLAPHVPSYVTRPTDDELFQHLLAGEYCYVLTPRQMGKSSLVARTMVRLRDERIGAAAVDLQDSGGLDEETFYLNILDELRRAFQLDVAVEEWWDANGRLGTSLRFRRFFTDHLLPQSDGNLVIFIDEIDTMLTMPFRDNFFAAIRALFNDRSGNPELERLTFVLLGVASPSDLIADSSRTPFNIGKKINLREFEPADAEPLLQGLQKAHPAQAKVILERIFHWTSGHPYLTQQLCLLINQTPDHDWHDPEIDTLVRQTFLSDEARNEDNIRLIQSRISASSNKRQLLRLYKQIYDGKVVKEDKASVAQNRLLLSGLVSLVGGQLQVRNQIYRNVFDRSWIQREMKINWSIVVGMMGIIGILLSLYNSAWLPNQQQRYENDFIFAETAPTRSAALGKLACMQPFLFGDSNNFDQRVSVLFFGQESWEKQKSIYDYRYFIDHPQDLICIVQDLYTSMLDENSANNTTDMLQIMADDLRQLNHSEAKPLIGEIDQWVQGRIFIENGELENALEAYNNAITTSNSSNPATFFERARIFTELGNISTDQAVSVANYELALADLDRVVSFILRQSESEVEEIPPTSSAILIPTSTETAVPTNTVISTVISPLPAMPTLESTNILTPNAISTTPLATTIMPTQPPTPTPRPLLPQFNTRSQWINLIRNFLQNEPALAIVLLNVENSENIYPNLFNSGLIETTRVYYGLVHVVQAGDTLGSISDLYAVSIEAIMAVNGITNPNLISVGDLILIPVNGTAAPESIAASVGGERPLAALDPAERNNYYSAFPDIILTPGIDYQAVIRTSKGDILLDLYEEEAPLAVNNFVFLATQGFYDGITFHRVLADFMAQAGDPTGIGTGGPGYQFEDEIDNGLVFDRRGQLAMANAGSNTNGSQFFITFVATDWLTGNHTIFGELLEGDDVLSALTLRDPQSSTSSGDMVERIDIIENPILLPTFTPTSSSTVVPTFTRISPTSTSIPFTPPPLSLPAVELISAEVRGDRVLFTWESETILEEDMYYVFRIGQIGELETSQIWTKENTYELAVDNQFFPDDTEYSWYVQIISDIDGDQSGENGGWIPLSKQPDSMTFFVPLFSAIVPATRTPNFLSPTPTWTRSPP